MITRECRTIQDVKDLLADFQVVVELRKGATITLQFPVSDNDIDIWKNSRFPKQELELIGDGDIDEPSGVNRDRTTRNVIRSLTGSEQFWRCTTTADQISRFKMVEGKNWGLNKITKRAGQPLTLHFDN